MFKFINLKNLTSIGLLSSLITGGLIAQPISIRNANASSEDKIIVAQATTSNIVGLELVLSVDVSTSVDREEFELQRDGYVLAFQDAEVQQAIKDLGSEGMVVNMQFWATDNVVDIGWHRLVVDDDDNITGLSEFIAAMNRVIRHGSKGATGQDIDENLKKKITTNGTAITSTNGTYMGGGTDIKLAIDEAKNSILNNDYQGRRLVIDVSGDGIPKNTPYPEATATADYGYRAGSCGYTLDCPPVADARDAAVRSGITINGLPIVGEETFSNKDNDENGNPLSMLEHRLDEHYRDYIVGGEKAFFVAATFDNFRLKAKQKILGEISNAPVNNAPIAQPDEAEVNILEPSVTIDVLSNDSDVNGDTLTISSVDNVTGGTATIVDNKVVFSPGNRRGTYTFQYTIIDDDELEPQTATADITVKVLAYAD